MRDKCGVSLKCSPRALSMPPPECFAPNPIEHHHPQHPTAVSDCAYALEAILPRLVGVSPSRLGPVDPSFRALSGHLKFTVRRHKFNKDSHSVGARQGQMRLVPFSCQSISFSRQSYLAPWIQHTNVQTGLHETRRKTW